MLKKVKKFHEKINKFNLNTNIYNKKILKN